MNPQSARDEDLLVALRGGQLAAFDELYRRYAKRLWGYFRRSGIEASAAEDLLQEVFLTVLRDRTFAPERGRLAPWLFQVARNRAIDSVRRQTRERATAKVGPEPQVEREQRIAEVRQALHSLPQGQQELLVLKQLGGFTYGEIAEIHGVPEGTVKSRLHTALQAFRNALLPRGKP